MQTLDLFNNNASGQHHRLGPSAMVLRDFALPHACELISAFAEIERAAPFRHMVTPGGFVMSVELTNCGALGLTTDRRGYRYTAIDPESGKYWPAMPDVFAQLAKEAAKVAGFDDFEPDACLANRYVPGARLSLHQDNNERYYGEPIVSVSLGMRATFLFGGLERNDPQSKCRSVTGT